MNFHLILSYFPSHIRIIRLSHLLTEAPLLRLQSWITKAQSFSIPATHTLTKMLKTGNADETKLAALIVSLSSTNKKQRQPRSVETLKTIKVSLGFLSPCRQGLTPSATSPQRQPTPIDLTHISGLASLPLTLEEQSEQQTLRKSLF